MLTMKKMITKFALKHPDFGIPGLMRYIAIANAIFLVLGYIKPSFISYLAFNLPAIFSGQIWRIISFVFIPPSTSILGIIAIYFYYVIGNTLEQYWGTTRFTLFILCGYVLTVLFGIIMFVVFRIIIELSASYIFLSMFLAFALLFPDAQALYMFIIPIKMKYLALIDLAFFVIEIFVSSFPVNLLPIIAILNVVLFCYDEIKYAFNFKRK